MKKNKKIYIVFINILFLLLIIFLFFLFNSKSNEFLFKNKDVYELIVNYDKVQKEIDKKLIKYSENKNISMSSPKVIVNPYNNSPLTALVIFYTKELTEIELYINDEFMTTFEKSNSHIIPIYGLRENYNNKITFIDDSNNKSTIFIETDDLENSDFYDYDVTKQSNEHIFVNFNIGKYAFDNEGYISWFMDMGENQIDFNFPNKLFYTDNYNRIIETDFMGKVYNTYYTDIFNINHKIEKIDDSKFLTISSSSLISEIDYDNKTVTPIFELRDALSTIDSNVDLSNISFYINYFYLDKTNNSIIVSIRGLDAIINYNLDNKKINWIFTNNSFFSKKYNKYKLKLVGKGDYFSGQHTPYLKDNLLYVFDNNNFMFSGIDALKYANKSSAVIYKIDDMKIKEIYRYNSNYASGWYGNFFEYENNKIINFGSVVNDGNENYSKIILLDNKDNIIRELTTKNNEKLAYEAVVGKFYDSKTLNYELDFEVENYFAYEKDYNKYILNKKFKGFKEKLTNAYIDETIIEYSKSGLKINDSGDFELLFVNENFEYYKIDFKETSSNYINLNNILSSMSGNYALYLKKDEHYYNTNMVFNVR